MNKGEEDLCATENGDLAMPTGLDADGTTAYETIMAFLRSQALTFTGGCKAFYSPAEWRDREEEYGTEGHAKLIVVYDGGDLPVVFRFSVGDGANYEFWHAMIDELKNHRLSLEECTIWYATVYATDDEQVDQQGGLRPRQEAPPVRSTARDSRGRE